MNTKLFAGLALAVALLIGGPAFGYDHRDGGGRAVAASRSGGPAAAVAVRGTRGGGTFVSGRSFTASYRGSARTFRSTPTVAFGGKNNSHGTFAFASHSGWSHNRVYGWNGHHYRWYGNGWFIVDPYPYYGYSDYDSGPAYTVYGPSYGNDNGGSVDVRVQQELARLGYYRGPIDGLVGPGTRAAIAAYQRDSGLHVTGTINGRLLDSLDLN